MLLSKKSSSYRGNSSNNHSEFDGIGHASGNFDSDKSRRKQSSPTNAFGEIEFTGLNQSAKYVKLPNSTPESNIQNILQTKWSLSHPTLVISIFGGNFEKKRKLKMIIKKGLWKAAESAGCWIVTEGLNMGIMKLAGEAVRDYTDAYGGNKMIAIGVAPWNRVARNEILENALFQGNYPAIYQSEEETENNEDGTVKDKTNEKSLDANHSHFCLFDCPAPKGNKSADVQFRSQFEHAISLWKTSTSDYGEPTEIRVPICGLLVGGDLICLKQVFNSMIENKCPVVVCQGSSGAADVLALALDACQKFDLEENADDSENVPLEVRLERIIRECLYKINPEINEFKKESLQLKEIVTNLGYLISVFDMEEDWDLDGYIISSLLSSAGSELSQNQLNLEQLEITLTLNRADIAKEKIFLENKKWKKGDLNDYMFNALMSDRHDFVKLFLEQGFSLEEFLTVYILEKLYTEQLKNLNSRIEIFHQLWEHHKTHRMVQNVKLREVGKVIRILVGDFYHPLYLSKEFQNLLLKTSSTENPLKTNRSYEQVMKANLKANAFNEYKMFVLSLHPHSKSLLHLNYIDQMDIDSSDRKFLIEDRANHSYANKSMEDAKCDTMTTMLPPSLTSLVPKHNRVEKLFNRIISVNKNYEDIINLHYKARTHNQCHRRASSLDMIDILNHKKLNQVSTSMKHKMKPHDCDTLSIHNQIDNQNMRRILSLNFNDSDQTKNADHKSSLSSTGSRASFLKYRGDNDSKLKEISLERPARELMIWSLLVGKLQMAELFWTMEKEQIAGALLASMLLNSLASKTDDFTDKEDYKTYSRHFEGQAEGVLNECYIEDEKRAQLLINKELKYYGQSSVILLAAQGQSIKFMAHPCCQDFLTNTWYGNLSSKNSAVRILGSVALGITIPFIIPKVITYKEDEALQSTQDKHISPMIMDNEKDDIENGSQRKFRKSKFLWLSKHQNSELFKYISKLKAFYFSPIVRFIYNAVSYLTFLLLFSTFLLFKFKVEFVPEEIILTFWIGTLLLEEIKQIFSATLSGISFSTYFSDGWNKLDSTGITLFVIGFVLRLITYIRNQDSLSDINQQYRIILTDPLFIGAQTCMGCSLFFFYVRVMYIFSFHISLGPKLIMIRKMISNDLIPFMIILSVFMVAYGVSAYANAYPLGLQFSDDMLKNSSSKFTTNSAKSMIMTILLKSYYPMFGDFGLDSIQGASQTFDPQQQPLVPTKISRTLIPLFMGLHVLLTNVLLFNLLIAMFTKTYEEIESSSVYYWNYQRYQMISEFVNKSPLVPPVIIFWHFYELYFLLNRKLFLNQEVRVFKTNPFCVNFSEDLKKERELVKWEHMKAMDYIRKINEPTQKSRQTRGADGRSLVFRGFGGGGGAAGALVPQIAENKPDLTGLIEEMNHQLDKRFKEVEVKFGKLGELESQITGLSNTIKDLGSTFADIKRTQTEIHEKIESFPKCQCLETVPVPNIEASVSDEQVTKLEMAVRSAILALKSEFQPVAKEIIAPPSSTKVEVEESDVDDPISFVSNDDTGDIKKDPFFAPQVEDPSTGRLVERVVNNHRIWRYLPFNFELYPGMRMKVPNSMVSWQVPYSDYNAFDASEEVLVYPNEHCRDANDPAKYKDSYNSYDQANKVKRQSMLGQYAIDPVTNAPLNPTGRTGLKGRGLLPHWGPNHTVIILFTRWFRTATGGPILQKNKKVMQYIGLERANRFGIPWFLVDHTHGCDMNVCSNKTTMAFLDQRLEAQFSNRKLQFIRKKLQSATCTQIFKGFLDDHLNADNAWIETFVINFHETENSLFTDDFLKIFIEPNSSETVKWLELAHSINLRTSHDMILKIVSRKNNAYF